MNRLVCTLGESPMPILIAIQAFIGKYGNNPRLRLLTSARLQTTAYNLVQKLRELGVITNPNDGAVHLPNTERDPAPLRESLDRLRDVRGGGWSAQDTLIDITGGTKVMSVAAAAWAQDNGFTWQYINGYSGQINPSQGQPTPYPVPAASMWLELAGENVGNLQQPDLSTLGCPEWLIQEAHTDREWRLWNRGNFPGTFIPERFVLWRQKQRLQIAYWLTGRERQEMHGPSTNNALLPQRLARVREKWGGDFADMHWAIPASSPLRGFNLAKARAHALDIRLRDEQSGVDIPPPAAQALDLPSEANADGDGFEGYAQVALLGDEPVPLVAGAEYHRGLSGHYPQRVYIVTSQPKLAVAARLWSFWQQRRLPEVRLVIVDPADPQSIQNGLRRCVASQVGLNLTGGTKLMSVLAFQALGEQAQDVIYLDGSHPVRL